MFFASCAVDPPMVNDDSFRGEIISSTLLHDWSITQTDSALSDYDPSLLTYPNDYNIKIYRVVYRTIDAAGNETQASGAVVIPSVLQTVQLSVYICTER